MLVRIQSIVINNETETRCNNCDVELQSHERICLLANIQKMEQPEIVGAICQDCMARQERT